MYGYSEYECVLSSDFEQVFFDAIEQVGCAEELHLEEIDMLIDFVRFQKMPYLVEMTVKVN